MRPSFWQTLHARRRREKGDRTQVVAYEDVLVFRMLYSTSRLSRDRVSAGLFERELRKLGVPVSCLFTQESFS